METTDLATADDWSRRGLSLGHLTTIRFDLANVEFWLADHWPTDLSVEVGTTQLGDGELVITSLCMGTDTLIAATRALTSDDGLVLLDVRNGLVRVRRRWGSVLVEAWGPYKSIDVDAVRAVINAPAPVGDVVEAGA